MIKVLHLQEVDAFFVTTNVVYTQNQTQGTCDEVEIALCYKIKVIYFADFNLAQHIIVHLIPST